MLDKGRGEARSGVGGVGILAIAMANGQWPWRMAILNMFRRTSRGATKISIGCKFEVLKIWKSVLSGFQTFPMTKNCETWLPIDLYDIPHTFLLFAAG